MYLSSLEKPRSSTQTKSKNIDIPQSSNFVDELMEL
jgi:hypothetical protein